MAEGFRLVAWYWTPVTGGATGLMGIPEPDPINFFGLATITFDTKISYFYLVLFITIISIVILYRIERSWFGLTWSSIRESENMARAVGIDVMGHKLLIFSITSFFMGIAGALYAHYMGALSAFGTAGSVFSMTHSLYILIYVVVGGEASFAGPIVGTFLLTIFPELVRGVKEYMPLIFGGLLIVMVFLMPDGIVGLFFKLLRWCRNGFSYLLGKAGKDKKLDVAEGEP
jgi:branched-chain amino acid transport system permease protein